MDTQQLEAFERILSREITNVNKNMDIKFESVLRAVQIVSEDVKDFDLRMRALELSNSNLNVQIQNEIGHLKGAQIRLEGDLNEVSKKYNDWMKYFKAQQDETIRYAQELFVDKDNLEQYKEKQQKRWEEQVTINEKNNGMRAALWTVAVLVLGLVATLIFDMITHGGVYGLVQSWGLSAP